MYKTALRLVDAAALFVLLPAAAGTRIVSAGFFVHVNGNIIQIVIRDKSFYIAHEFTQGKPASPMQEFVRNVLFFRNSKKPHSLSKKYRHTMYVFHEV